MGIVTMPKMGDTMNEGTIVTWIKKEGDQVNEGDVIAEIETEKAAIEIESFESGVLSKIIVREGETVPVGAPIAQIGEGSASDEPPAAKADKAEAAPAAPPAKSATPPSTPEPAAPAAQSSASPPSDDRTVASPLARRIARENELDLRLIKGTGPGGRVIAEDVESWIKTRAGGPGRQHAAPARQPAQQPVPAGDVWAPGPPFSKMRQVIARRMSESKQQVPHFYLTMDIDMGPAMALRDQLNGRGEGFAKIGPNDLIIKAVADALRAQPAMRVAYDGANGLVTDRVNIGVAVALPEGLIVPVVRDADAKNLNEIALEVRELAEKARAGKLLPDEYAGGTFTVTNLGMYGIEDFIAIVNPPEPGILAVGAVAEVPVVVDGKITVGTRMKVTLSGDHRAVDGATGADFLKEVKRRLEQPLLLVR